MKLVSLVLIAAVLAFAVQASPTRADVYSFGDNWYGQLGTAPVPPLWLPPVPIAGLKNVKAIAAGRFHALAVKNDGTVLAWGSNEYGCLGHGLGPDNPTPTPVVGLTDVVQVAAGTWFNLALKADGTLVAWGRNAGTSLCGQPPNVPWVTTPTPISWFASSNPSERIVQIAASSGAGFALKIDGTVWAWGDPGGFVLGTGMAGYSNPTFVAQQVPGLPAIRSLSAVMDCVMAVDTYGNLWGWGFPGYRTYLGAGSWRGNNLPPFSPYRITELSSVKSGCPAEVTPAALMEDGTVWTWGDYTSAMPFGGAVPPNGIGIPAQVPGLTDVVRISPNVLGTYVIKSNGELWGWGYGAFNLLGSNPSQFYTSPVQISEVANAALIASGYSYTLVVTNTAPTANAGSDQSVISTGALTAVTLDGSASFDSDNDVPLTYTWTLGAATIGTGAGPTVNLPTGTHTITLTVNDPIGASKTDTVLVTVMTAAQATQQLVTTVTAMGLPNGLANSLQQAINFINSGNITSAKNKLDAFKNQVSAMLNSGQITAAEAAQLIAAADAIKASL